MIMIMEILERCNVRMRSSHIAGVNNMVADRLSRTYDASDYSVTDECLDRMLRFFDATIAIDLFAAPHNSKAARFYSFGACEGNLDTDALAYSWKEEKGTLYAFPPKALIKKVLKKLRIEGGL
jgi:hypothetical protein